MVQSSSEVVQDAEVVQQAGTLVCRCRGAGGEVQKRFSIGSAEAQQRCRGVEVLRCCIGAEVQRGDCAGGDCASVEQVQMCRGGAEVQEQRMAPC